MDSTVVQIRTAQLGQHPSFPGGLPAIIAQPQPVDYCTDCAWLAGRIRAGRDVEQYAALSIEHVTAAHPSYAIHMGPPSGPSQTRHNLSGGAR